MQTENRPEELTSQLELINDETKALQPVSASMQELEKSAPKKLSPAKLPASSQAAIAQRLNDVPVKTAPGFFYHTPHLRLQPKGWRTKRHLRRKFYHLTFAREARVERKSAATLRMMAGSLLTAIVICGAVFLTVFSFIQATQQRFGGQVTRLEDILPKDSLRAYDSHGQQIYVATDQGLQISVPLSKISRNMINAQIAIEDQNFWKNDGYDITGIVRAASENLSHGQVVSGGSTITQQLIKNTIVGNKENVLRKMQEIVLAPEVTRHYTKEQILDMYLNTTYYGEQAYGVEAAAFLYYNLQPTAKATAASQLDIAQAAMLAGVVSAPIGRDPYLHPEAALNRVQEVLQQMYAQGYITASQRADALKEVQQPTFLHRGVVNNGLAPHFTNYMLRELASTLHVKAADLSRSGLIVSTTLDLPLQNQVLQIARKQIATLSKNHVTDAAEVVIDYRTGAIRTLLGNINPEQNQFDIASQGFRQPGSSFKPFTYVTAFEQGVSPGQPVLDEPVTFQMCCGLPPYTPHDYEFKSMGLISYRTALQNSLNIPALKLANQIGYDKALATAQKMGITEYKGSPNLTLALGALSIHLLDEASAYGAFGNNGVHVQKHSITVVKDSTGKTIYQFDVKGNSQQVVTPQAAFIMTDVLSDNVARTPEFGKCSPLLLYSTSMQQCYMGNPGTIYAGAAKTGTTNDFRDSWTVGYTPNGYVVGAWSGNDDNSEMLNVNGIMGAAPIWHDTMLQLIQGQPMQHFSGPPAGVVKKTVSYPGITTTDWYLQK